MNRKYVIEKWIVRFFTILFHKDSAVDSINFAWIMDGAILMTDVEDVVGLLRVQQELLYLLTMLHKQGHSVSRNISPHHNVLVQ